MDSVGVVLIDIRRPSVALGVAHHESCVNHITWAPHSANHLLCGTDDGFAVIWDVKGSPPSAREPEVTSAASSPQPSQALAYECDQEVYQVLCPSSQPDYLALGMAKQIEVVRCS